MNTNPFGPPPKPPKKGTVRARNPFDDDEEVVIDFQPSPVGPRSSSSGSAKAVDRFSPLVSTDSATSTQNTQSAKAAPQQRPARMFGGGSLQSPTSESLLSRARSQFLPHSHKSAGGSSSYSRVDTNSAADSNPTTPNRPTTESTANVNQSDPRVPSRFKSDGRQSVASPNAQSAVRSPLTTTALDSCTDYDTMEMGTPQQTSGTGTAASTPAKPPKTAKKDNKRPNSTPTQKAAGEQGTTSSTESTSAAEPTQRKTKHRKKKERKKTFCVDSKDENAVIRFLLSDRVYGYPHTYGGRLSNFRYYVQYNHPILSIYFTHKLHPFSRKQRFIVFLCSLSFAVCFAFILLDTPLVPVIATCSSVCDCKVVTDDADQPNPHWLSAGDVAAYEAHRHGGDGMSSLDVGVGHCQGGYNDGRECDAYNTVCKNYQSWMLSCTCGACTVLYDALLRFLATCSCLQGRKRFQNNCLGVRFKALVEYFGSITLLFFSFLSAVFTLLTMVLCWYEHIAAKVLFVMVLSELWSTVQWIVWATPWFLYNYRADRRAFYEKLKRRSARHGGNEEGGIELV